MRRSLAIIAAVSLALSTGCDSEKEESRRVAGPPTGKAAFALSHSVEPPIKRGESWRIVVPDVGMVEFTAFDVVISAIELHLCEERTSGLRELFVSTAYAHVPSSATRLGVPFVENLLDGSKGAKTIGELSPPVGSYCRAYVVFAPADDDVTNLTPIPLEDLVGATAVATGRYRLEAAEEWTEFTWSTDVARPVEVALESPSGEPIRLKSPRDDVFILLDKALASDYVEGVTAEQIRSGEAIDAVMEGVMKSVSLKRF